MNPDKAREILQEVSDRKLEVERQRERDNTISPHYNPFGKPGGGARNANAHGSNNHSPDPRAQAYGETLRQQMQQSKRPKSADPIQNYDPWGKGYGAPQRDTYGNIVPSPPKAMNPKNEYKSVAEMVGGASLRDTNRSGSVPMERLVKERTDIFGNSLPSPPKRFADPAAIQAQQDQRQYLRTLQDEITLKRQAVCCVSLCFESLAF